MMTRSMRNRIFGSDLYVPDKKPIRKEVKPTTFKLGSVANANGIKLIGWNKSRGW